MHPGSHALRCRAAHALGSCAAACCDLSQSTPAVTGGVQCFASACRLWAAAFPVRRSRRCRAAAPWPRTLAASRLCRSAARGRAVYVGGPLCRPSHAVEAYHGSGMVGRPRPQPAKTAVCTSRAARLGCPPPTCLGREIRFTGSETISFHWATHPHCKNKGTLRHRKEVQTEDGQCCEQ